MTFIDWSDTEGMFGLLIEYVSDEKNEFHGDIKRQEFLSELLSDLRNLAENAQETSNTEMINQLQAIYNSIDQEFKRDDVSIHFKDCMEELERVNEKGQ